jgi:hypothetical protein
LAELKGDVKHAETANALALHDFENLNYINIMNTIELNPSLTLLKEETTKVKHYSIARRFAEFAERQNNKRLAWFMISLLAQGVLFLPVPAALMYYYDAPIAVLIVTMIVFFANIIAGMGGSKTSVLIFLIGLSTIVHLAMIMLFVL